MNFQYFNFQKLLFEQSRELFTHRRTSRLSAGWRIARRINIVYLAVLCLVLFVAGTPAVSAHVLKVDGSMGVTMHIDPDDSPAAKKESTIFVSIKDGEGRFDEKNPAGCDCMLQIIKDRKVIKTMPITTGGTYNALSYVFPTNGTYVLQVSGKPNGKGSTFQPFRASFEYYVKSSNSSAIDPDQTPIRSGELGVDRTNELFIHFPYLVILGGMIILCMFLNPFAKKQNE